MLTPAMRGNREFGITYQFSGCGRGETGGSARIVGRLPVPDNLAVDAALKGLYAYLRENGLIEPIREFETAQLRISPPDVSAKIETGDENWKSMVPEKVATRSFRSVCLDTAGSAWSRNLPKRVARDVQTVTITFTTSCPE